MHYNSWEKKNVIMFIIVYVDHLQSVDKLFHDSFFLPSKKKFRL